MKEHQSPQDSNSADTVQWTKVILPVSGWFDLRPGELWRYRDLVLLFVRRDFVSIYKQTILGPLWYLIQPLMTTLIFTVIFSVVAKIPTDGLPPVMFYLSGLVAWRYFADCLQKTSNTFVSNAGIFGKVYFPRLTVPVSVIISNLVSMGIQLILFAGFWLFFYMKGAAIQVRPSLIFLPLLILQMAALSLGCGIIVSSLTTKYRDLTQLVGFGVQLWMYASPVVFPVRIISEKYQWLMALNPMSQVIESFRYMTMGVGSVNAGYMTLSVALTLLILGCGVVLFSRVEKSFMDTV